MGLLLVPALTKQKSAEQLHGDNKPNNTCHLSTSSLEKIKLNVLGLYQQQLGSGCVVTGTPGQAKIQNHRITEES